MRLLASVGTCMYWPHQWTPPCRAPPGGLAVCRRCATCKKYQARLSCLCSLAWHKWTRGWFSPPQCTSRASRCSTRPPSPHTYPSTLRGWVALLQPLPLRLSSCPATLQDNAFKLRSLSQFSSACLQLTGAGTLPRPQATCSQVDCTASSRPCTSPKHRSKPVT